MTQANLTETLFKPSFKHPETSTLIRRVQHHASSNAYSPLEGENPGSCWYRMLNRLMWIARGISPQDILDVQARIASSHNERTDETLLDTVIGYRGGNWIYEWVKQAMMWQQRAIDNPDSAQAGQCWLQAANLYSIAAYPYLKGDELSEQALVLANKAYEEAAPRLGGEMKELEFAIPGGSSIMGFLHLPVQGKAPFPTVLVCGGLDTLQSDHYHLFHDYLAPLGIAMLTIDMPSVGFSSKWKLTQDSSFLHQQVLKSLPDIAWIDHTRVGVVGFRFGANVAVRLAYLEASRIKAVACLGPIVHTLLTDGRLQEKVPEMYMDMLASRLGMYDAADTALLVELNRYSLKTQGLLGRRCPTPMLSAFWENDIASPEEESRLIVSSSACGKLLRIPDKPVYSNLKAAMQEICRWLNHNLNE